MKTIVTLTDLPDGGVNVHIMTQLSAEETLDGKQPEQSPGYQTAQAFTTIVGNAKALAAEMRTMQAELAEREQGAARCWH